MYLVVFLLSLTLNLFMALFTVGVSLLVTIPATTLFLRICDCVYYYSGTARRFYVDRETIVN
jgi:hypothetical protein